MTIFSFVPYDSTILESLFLVAMLNNCVFFEVIGEKYNHIVTMMMMIMIMSMYYLDQKS